MGCWFRSRTRPDHLLRPSHYREEPNRKVHLCHDRNRGFPILLRYHMAGAHSSCERDYDRWSRDWHDQCRRPIDGYCWSADLSSKVWSDVPRQLHLLNRLALNMFGSGVDELVLRS
jgi:hypothetical protein